MPKIGKYWVSQDHYYWPHDTAHTWAKIEDGKARVGVDDFAQKQAGELKFMRLFPAGKKVEQGKRFGTLETAKWVGPLLSPVSGTIMESNQEVLDKPTLVNEDPYGKGWMVVIEPSNLDDDMTRLVKGDSSEAAEWMKKDIREVAKDEVK